MAPTSLMLKQHISRIEYWIETIIRTNPYYLRIKDLGLIEKDGVLFRDPDCGISFSPSSVSGDFNKLEFNSFYEKFYAYISLLKELDSDMVIYAVELEDRRKEYEITLIEETIAKKGILWIKIRDDISKIQVIQMHDMMNFRKLEYYDLSDMNKKKTQSMRFCELFLTKKDAYNPKKEGYHDA